jgi:hypothetical protein
LTVNRFGTYRVSLVLGAPNGQTIKKQVEVALDTGTQPVTFTFTADEVLKLGSPGPYTLNSLNIDLETDSDIFPLSQSTSLGSLSVTDPSLFQRPWIVFTGTFTPRGIDTNGDGLIDELDVDVGVQVLANGAFDVGATLIDPNGDEITTNFGNQQTLTAGTGVITLRFSGPDIKAHGVEGPFTVTDLSISDPYQEGTLDPVGTISGFTLSQFGTASTPPSAPLRNPSAAVSKSAITTSKVR